MKEAKGGLRLETVISAPDPQNLILETDLDNFRLPIDSGSASSLGVLSRAVLDADSAAERIPEEAESVGTAAESIATDEPALSSIAELEGAPDGPGPLIVGKCSAGCEE